MTFSTTKKYKSLFEAAESWHTARRLKHNDTNRNKKNAPKEAET